MPKKEPSFTIDEFFPLDGNQLIFSTNGGPGFVHLYLFDCALSKVVFKWKKGCRKNYAWYLEAILVLRTRREFVTFSDQRELQWWSLDSRTHTCSLSLDETVQQIFELKNGDLLLNCIGKTFNSGFRLLQLHNKVVVRIIVPEILKKSFYWDIRCQTDENSVLLVFKNNERCHQLNLVTEEILEITPKVETDLCTANTFQLVQNKWSARSSQISLGKLLFRNSDTGALVFKLFPQPLRSHIRILF